MTTTTQLPTGRYRVTGPAVWGNRAGACRGISTGDIVELRYPTAATPDGDGDVQVRRDDGPLTYIRASSLTPVEAAEAAPATPVVGGKIRFTQEPRVQGARVNIGDEVEITSVADGGATISTRTLLGNGDWSFSVSRGGFDILPPTTPPAPVVPVVGGKIRFTQTYVQGAEVNIGDEVEITSVQEDDGDLIYTATTRVPGAWCFRLSRGGFDVLPPPPVTTERHKADIARIGAKLLAAAAYRGGDYATAYDQIVETLNPTLAVKLPERERPFVVELGGDFGTVTVTARNLDEAKTKVRASLSALR